MPNKTVIVHPKMPEALYFADPAPSPSLNASTAKILINRSPLHAWTQHPRLNPQYSEEEKQIFDIGHAAHALLLEGLDKMVECPFDDWRKKEAREQRDLIRAQGKIPLLSKYVRDVNLMIYAAKKALRESELEIDIGQCETEETIIWTDSDGIFKRARLDARDRKRHLILDYKSTENSDPFTFQRQIDGLDYDLQAAHYCDAYRASQPTCDQDPPFVFVVQERSAPYAVSLIGLDPMFLDLGQQKMARATAIWKRCLAKNDWPAYSNRVYWAEPPAWALADFERRNLGE